MLFGELYKLVSAERNICIIIFFSNEHKQRLNKESHSAEFPPEFRLCFIFTKYPSYLIFLCIKRSMYFQAIIPSVSPKISLDFSYISKSDRDSIYFIWITKHVSLHFQSTPARRYLRVKTSRAYNDRSPLFRWFSLTFPSIFPTFPHVQRPLRVHDTSLAIWSLGLGGE